LTLGYYDVVIVGGAVMGSSLAWFLSNCDDFDGSVLVIERDPTYTFSSTARTNSCMRQQFSNELNIEISRFGAEYVRNFRHYMGAIGSADDAGNGGNDARANCAGGANSRDDVPDIAVDHFGYMYLADSEDFAQHLKANQRVQAANGAATRIMTVDQITAEYPFYNLEDIICGSHNPVDEGFFDSGTMFDCWRRMARRNGVTFVNDQVVAVNRRVDVITSVTLASGSTVACGLLVNATGPRAAVTAQMAGLDLPVEPRKRYTFIFNAAEPLPIQLPLTIDPSGVHVRSDGAAYMAGCAPDDDVAVAFGDFNVDPDIFEEKVWPVLAHRIPAFERIKVTSRWAGHYAYNTFDHNAVIGPHSQVCNFIFANGFSGHGMQQSPAVGRGLAELITYGEYRTIDLSPLGYDRLTRSEPFSETAII